MENKFREKSNFRPREHDATKHCQQSVIVRGSSFWDGTQTDFRLTPNWWKISFGKTQQNFVYAFTKWHQSFSFWNGAWVHEASIFTNFVITSEVSVTRGSTCSKKHRKQTKKAFIKPSSSSTSSSFSPMCPLSPGVPLLVMAVSYSLIFYQMRSSRLLLEVHPYHDHDDHDHDHNADFNMLLYIPT